MFGAGAGTRMHPLTLDRPKVLCPVASVPLVDGNIDRVRAVTDDVAVNIHHGADLLRPHLEGRVRISEEHEVALGTAGALAQLASWIDGRPTVVVNGDSWCDGGLEALVAGWDGERTAVLVAGQGPFRAGVGVCGAIVPWKETCRFEARPMGLFEMSWRAAMERGEVITVEHAGRFVDCGTPADYLRANLLASGGTSVVDGHVAGRVERSVVWEGAVVHPREVLVDAIRTPGRTVLIR